MGCVEVTSPDASTVPHFGYWGYPFGKAVVNPALGPGSLAANLAAQSAQVFTPAEFAGATQYIGVTQLSGRGSIGAALFDCLGNPAGGVRVTIDSHDPLVTVYSGSDDAGTTSRAGLAFFYNVPPGTVQVTATPRFARPRPEQRRDGHRRRRHDDRRRDVPDAHPLIGCRRSALPDREPGARLEPAAWPTSIGACSPAGSAAARARRASTSRRIAAERVTGAQVSGAREGALPHAMNASAHAKSPHLMAVGHSVRPSAGSA